VDETRDWVDRASLQFLPDEKKMKRSVVRIEDGGEKKGHGEKYVRKTGVVTLHQFVRRGDMIDSFWLAEKNGLIFQPCAGTCMPYVWRLNLRHGAANVSNHKNGLNCVFSPPTNQLRGLRITGLKLVLVKESNTATGGSAGVGK
jgi:hypothetical protein